jgi:hypothetical protein
MIKTASLPALLLMSAGGAWAQAPDPATMTPAYTKRAPEMGDTATNPSDYDRINRATQNLDAQGKARQPQPGRTRPANAAEILLGSEVRDKRNKPVGTIEMVEADGAVVVTAAGKVKVPLEAIGTDGKGLIIGITKAEFDKLVAAANGSPAG